MALRDQQLDYRIRVLVEKVAEVDKLQRELVGLQKEMRDTGRESLHLRKETTGLQGALRMGLAVEGVRLLSQYGQAAGRLIVDMVALGDQIGKVSDKLGVSTDFLQAWRYEATLAGSDDNTADLALQRFTRRLGEAQKGTGELLPVLRQYNIQLTDSAGRTRTSREVLEDYADVIAATLDPQERLRLAFKAFDSEGAGLVNMLVDGGEGLREMQEEAEAAGVIVGEEFVDAAERAQDAIEGLTRATKTNLVEAIGAMIIRLEDVLALDRLVRDGVSLRRQAVRELAEEAGMPFNGRENVDSVAAQLRRGITPEKIHGREHAIVRRGIDEDKRRRDAKAAELRAEAEAEAKAGRLRQIELDQQAQELEFERKMGDLRLRALSDEERLVALQGMLVAAREKLASLTADEAQSALVIRQAQQDVYDLELQIEELRIKADGPETVRTLSGIEPPLDLESGLARFRDRMKSAGSPGILADEGLTDAFAAINDELTRAITLTGAWESALLNIRVALADSIVSAIIQMFQTWITQRLLAWAVEKGLSGLQEKERVGAMTRAAGEAGALGLAWAPAALSASIATLGGAAKVGTSAYIAALFAGVAAGTIAQGAAGFLGAVAGTAGQAAGQSVAGFADGGRVTGPGGPFGDRIAARLSDGEFVNTARSTGQNLPFLEFANAGGRIADLLEGAASGGGGPINLVLVDSRRRALEELRGREGRKVLVDLAGQDRLEMGIPT